ncbi:hypothetical protein CRYUN_Cryun29cG0079600 [Craigia yunnanensis]
MTPPNPRLESENDSEASSQVASNISAHEASPDPSKDSTTTTSCLTNPVKAQPDSGSVSLDLILHFSASDAEMKGLERLVAKGEDNGEEYNADGILSDRYTSLASLPPHGSAIRSLGIKAHSAMHQGIMPSQRPLDARAEARFDQGYFGMPMFMEDDDVDFFWPGSFRQVNEGVSGNRALEFAQNSTLSSNVGFVAMASPPRTDTSSPDLTLKL